MNSKSIFKKQNILPVVVLLAICIVVAGVLGAVNLLTAERIEENENAKIYASLAEVMDGYITPVEKLPEGTPKSVTAMYEVKEDKDSDELIGKIVTVSVKGYAGNILMTVGVYKDGTVSKVVITSQSESHGKAGMATYPDKFTGVTGVDGVEAVEHFAGATVSSTAIRGGVADAVKAASGVAEAEPEEVLPKTDEEILALAGQLVGEGVTFENVTPEESVYTKRIYKASGGRGYVAYIVVMSRYGTPETETLVHFTNKGVISGIEKLTWSPSPANPDYGYYPPSEDVVDAYYTKYVGKTAEQIYSGFIREEGEDKEIEHASGATSTSIGLATSVVEAGMLVDELIKNDIPRDESEIIDLVGDLLDGVSFTDITPEDGMFVKRLYKASGNKGYVAYIVVISGYGTPESEALVHFGSTGKIVGMKKILWSPSPANPEYPFYNPPTEEMVDEYYAKFIGQTSATLAEGFVKGDNKDKEIEHASGATTTSNNLATAVLEAALYADELIKKDMPRAEQEILDLAGQLVSGATLTDITPEDNEIVKRLYKLDKSKGYIAYIVVISGYGTPETETLVHIDNSGKIVGMKKIVWSPSPANPEYPFYTPPTEEMVDEYYAKFIGQTSVTLAEGFVKGDNKDKEIEHASGATTTSNNLATAVLKAFEFVDELIRNDIPRAESEVLGYVGGMTGGSSYEDVTPGSAVYVKRLYKLAADQGFVAYLVVISPNYGTVETETLIHFDNSGKIVAVNKLIWKTSDAGWGYVPPTQEEADLFYAKLIGNTSATFANRFVKAEGEEKEVEHVSNATSTTNRLVSAISEAFEIVDGMIVPTVDNTPRIVGLAIIFTAFASVAGVITYKFIKRRRAK